MSGFIIDRPNGIQIFQLRAVIGAIRLESHGMRHSSGKSVKAMWARQLGMKRTAKHAEVIAKLEEKIKEIEAQGDLGIREI